MLDLGINLDAVSRTAILNPRLFYIRSRDNIDLVCRRMIFCHVI